MARERYDRSSKWLIEHFGRALLWMAGVRQIVSCRAVAPELVHPRQIPDGLLEVRLPDQPEPFLFLVELVTFPRQRVKEQMLDDALLVHLDRRRLPEILTIVLCPSGQITLTGEHGVTSPLGWSRLDLRWRVIELWRLRAADLLATQDVGLIPWVPLTSFDEPPEQVLWECRQRIDSQAMPEQRAGLLTVTHVFSLLRYDSLDLKAILGDRRTMLELPFLKELEEELTREVRESTTLSDWQSSLLLVLESRFAPVPTPVQNQILQIRDPKLLRDLVRRASTVADLNTFQTALPPVKKPEEKGTR